MNEQKVNDLIIVKPDKCVGCNACVRTCPAPEANITKQLENGKFVTTVDSSHCIACGECVRNCSHGAREYIDDTEEALSSIKKQKTIVIAAPAIKSVFPDQWKSILSWFKEQGCMVFDVSFGADICTWAHLRAIENNMVSGGIITQPCAAIVKYIETYQPSLVRSLSPIHSPMLCGVTYIKKYMRRNEKILALSPCIAKKNEFTETGLVEYNVTFQKLMDWFTRNGVFVGKDGTDDFHFDFDGEQGQLGGIYPRAGGLRDNLWMHNPELNIVNSEGVNKVYKELDLMATLPDNIKPQVFDVLSCEFGCNVGAGTGNKKSFFEVMKTMREVELEAKSRRKTSGGFFRGAEDKLFKRFDEELNIKDFFRTYVAQTASRIPSDAELEPIFTKMGKHTEADREYNCHACGHDTCREMAIAIARGLDSPDNCAIHAKSVLLAKHSDTNRKNEMLSEIVAACTDISSKLTTDVGNISDNMKSIRETNNDTNDRAASVHDLLSNVVEFCRGNDSLDKASMGQLIQILETTLAAFDQLNTSIKKSNGTTLSVDAYILEIHNLIDNLKTTLKPIE